MSTDEGNNNYTSNQNPENSQNLTAPQNSDFSNINDLKIKYIEQPNPNELYIQINDCRWMMFLGILFASLVLGVCIYLILTEKDDVFLVYIYLFTPCYVIIGNIISFFLHKVSLHIFLQENSIRLLYTLNCGCHKTIIINNGDVKEFVMENNKIITMIYLDNKKKDEIITSNFYGDEGNYLIYVLNNHVKKLSSNIPEENV